MIDVRDPELRKEGLAEAASVILSGGIVAVPTESFYGLAVSGLDEAAIRRLLRVKKMGDGHPILLLIPTAESAREYVRRFPPVAEKLMKSFWPGGLTLVMEAGAAISPLLTASTGKIGLRLSSHPVATGLAGAAGAPITGTSANITGSRPCVSAEEVQETLGQEIDLVLDGGITEGEKGSTVLDVTTEPPIILREGLVPGDRLREMGCETG
jgi:L-threonylcarbamoyladenylate synthase